MGTAEDTKFGLLEYFFYVYSFNINIIFLFLKF